MSLFDKISIRQRILLLILFVGGILSIAMGFYSFHIFKEKTFLERGKAVERITEIAYSILLSYEEMVQNGNLTEEEAKLKAVETISKLKYDEGKNYIWINDNNGVFIYHIKSNLIGSKIQSILDKKGISVFPQELLDKVKAEKKAFVKYRWAKVSKSEELFDKLSSMRYFEKWGWMVGTGLWLDDLQKEIQTATIQIALIAFASLIIISVLANFTLGQSIITPIEKLAKLSGELAQNNLCVEIPDDKNKTEIGELNRAFKKFVVNLRGLISQINESSAEVNSGAVEMNKSSEQIAQGAQQAAESSSHLATGAQEISSNLEKGVESVNTLNSTIQKISKDAEVVSELGNLTEKNANAGNVYVAKSVEKIDSIKVAAGEISVTIEELGALSTNIGQIVEIIKNIANQTNLLALNAAIEAARAGEHGKGFAVVADEVKKLAGQSADATDKITDMIKEIQSKTSAAVKKVDNAKTEVEEGVVVVNEAGESLKSIINDVKSANTKIHGIAKEINDLAKGSETIVKMMENISAVTEETAASAEEISSITEEQTASLEEVTASSHALVAIAKELSHRISAFKI